MRSFRSKPVGWQNEPYRHSLAARGYQSSKFADWMSDMHERSEYRARRDEIRREFELIKDIEQRVVLDRKNAEILRAAAQKREDAAALVPEGDTSKLRSSAVDFRKEADELVNSSEVEERDAKRRSALLQANHRDEYLEFSSSKAYNASKVDLNKYAGTWRQESVKNEPWFQRGATDVRARYSRNPDGTLKVVNTARKDGRLVKIEGTARSVSKDNRHLKVSFGFPFPEGDYSITKVNKDYTRAVVKGGKTEWVLVR